MDMQLIKKQDFIAATHIDRYNMDATAGLLMKLFGIEKLNHLYANLRSHRGTDFLDQFFEQMSITIEVSEADLKKIPKNGAFITVSNHPYGGLDGLALMKIILAERPDFKVMVNFLLQQIEPIADYLMPVNPFEDESKSKASSLAGMRAAIKQVRSGAPLGLFPAGEVSRFQSNARSVVDREWHMPALKLIHKAQVPVVPVYFEGNNSALFHILDMIHSNLSMVSLAGELMKKRNSRIRVRIGKPVTVAEQEQFADASILGRYLRAKTYALGSALEVKKFFKKPFKFPSKPKEIASAAAPSLLQAEINNLQDSLLFTEGKYEVYIAKSEQISLLMHEIGRLREISFRQVGEGSNKAIDLDEYDLYYLHLFIWDREATKVVGAYRLGKGDEILANYGKMGFYTGSLFEVSNAFRPTLQQTIELGRSFIVKEYQQKRLPLFLLWKGILVFLMKNPKYRYLLGPVSISNAYSHLSKSLIVAFVKSYHYDEEMAKLVKPRKAFKAKVQKVDPETLVRIVGDDFKGIDHIVSDIEPRLHSLPILLKKYIKQNARIIGFNIDPKFAHALDGLMILDLENLPAGTIENLSRELETKPALTKAAG